MLLLYIYIFFLGGGVLGVWCLKVQGLGSRVLLGGFGRVWGFGLISRGGF